MISLRFTTADADRAYDAWGANCGPGAIAAVCGLTLDEVRPHLGDFEAKRYTNPTLMWATLRSLGVPFAYRGGDLGHDWWPTYGLARVQWEGPWTHPGVPIRARYRHSHWIGVQRGKRHPSNIGIFDINAMASGGWVGLDDWASTVVPWILRTCVPRADGGWHITHVVEIDEAHVRRRLAMAEEA